MTTQSPPLADSWQLYVHFRSQPGSYKQSFLAYGPPFDSIGGFWSTFNALPRPSRAFTPPHQMAVGGQQIKAFSLFKGKIEPTWEDPVNAVGSELYCRCQLEAPVLDEMWLAAVLACVGNRLPAAVGVRAVDNSLRGKTQSKLEVWCPADTDEPALQARVLSILKETIPAPPPFEFQAHADKSTMERKFFCTLKSAKKKARAEARPPGRPRR